jgi:hypothetical protein
MVHGAAPWVQAIKRLGCLKSSSLLEKSRRDRTLVQPD